MPTNEEINKRIIAAIEGKIGDRAVACPMCGEQSWEVGYHYTVLAVSEHPTKWSLGGKALPLISMMCKKCGNTQFMNLLGLGFKREDLESLKFSKEEDVKRAKPNKEEV